MSIGNRDWVEGEYPAAAIFDTFIQDQVIALFDNATDRDDTVANNGMGSEADLVDGQRATTRDDGRSWVWMVTNDPDPGDGYWVEVDRWKAWGTYVPTVVAASGGTDPTLGSGPTQFGRWTRKGSHATVAVVLEFGTGAGAGSGIYEIAMPTACPINSNWYTSQEVIVGHGLVIDSSTGERYSVAVKAIAENRVRLEAAGLTGPVNEANLLAWGDSDTILSATLNYEMEMF